MLPLMVPSSLEGINLEVFFPIWQSFTIQRTFFAHAASLGQAFAHCRSFSTAASRRGLGRISVPVWPDTLSGRLPIVALVGHYPTNKLMGGGTILQRQLQREATFHLQAMRTEGRMRY